MPSGARWPTPVGQTPARDGRSDWPAGRSPGRRRPSSPAGSGRHDPRCRSPVRWRPPPPARTAGRRRADPRGERSPARYWLGSPGLRAGRGLGAYSDRAHRGRRSSRLLYPWRSTARRASCPVLRAGETGSRREAVGRARRGAGAPRFSRHAPAGAADWARGPARRAWCRGRPRRDGRGRARSRWALGSPARDAAARPPPRHGAAYRPAPGRTRSPGAARPSRLPQED